jgi:ABC-2 type transport system ATP-binding protein
VLKVRDVEKSYGDHPALSGVSLDIAAGQILALLGRNGAGKTTLVGVVAGLREPQAGSIEIGGIDAIADKRKARTKLGIAPQETGVFPSVSVRTNLVVFGRLAGMNERDLPARVEDVATALGLAELLDRTPRTLSGGERRRLHTAIALVHHPPLLLLDEPTVGADIESRNRLLALVRQLANDGAAVLYTTHYLHEVESLAADVAIIDQGKIIAAGARADLVGQHGIATVVVTFADAVPPLEFEDLGSATVEERVVRIVTESPDEVTPRVLHRLGPSSDRLQSIEIVRPSLESVYLNLTGERLPARGEASA